MDVFVATSRGKHMAEHFNKGNRAIFAFEKSATLEKLGKMAEQIINENYHLYQDVSHIHPNIVHVIGGLPDTTHMLTDTRYQEVIYTEHPDQTLTRLRKEYIKLSDFIFSKNAIPCFATYPTMSLTHWNHYRMEIGCTQYLIHFKEYEDMNYLLNQAIINTNSFIRELNETNNVITPNFSSHIMKKRGQGRGHSIRYNHLYDGCHVDKYVVGQWILELEHITSANRYRNASEAALKDIAGL